MLAAGRGQDQDWAGAAGLPHNLFADTWNGAGTAERTELM
jgi:hypothetical protein